MKTKCKNCGNETYDITITTDGYKEYRCKACGSVIDRTNLLEEYKQFNINHVPFSKETDLEKLKALRNKYREDYESVLNFVNFLSNKNRNKLNDYELKALNVLEEEFINIGHTIKTAYDSVKERIEAVKQELAYNKIKQDAIVEYDPNKKYTHKKEHTNDKLITAAICVGAVDLLSIVVLVIALITHS